MTRQLDIHLLLSVKQIAQEAAHAIAVLYQDSSKWDVSSKDDKSPLTAADMASHRVIESGLSAISDWPIVSEESVQTEYTQTPLTYWLVDPLDGTKEFIAKTGEFCVCIALIQDGIPVMGMIVSPVTMECYGALEGQGAFYWDASEHKSDLSVRGSVVSPVRLLTSRSHQQQADSALLNSLSLETTQVVQGSALKFCQIAKGQADIYIRQGPTSLWDIAAGDCIIRLAGGVVLNQNREPMSYDLGCILNPPFVASGDKSLLDQIRFSELSVKS